VGAEGFGGGRVAAPFSPLSVFWHKVQLVPIIGERVHGQCRLTGGFLAWSVSGWHIFVYRWERTLRLQSHGWSGSEGA